MWKPFPSGKRKNSSSGSLSSSYWWYLPVLTYRQCQTSLLILCGQYILSLCHNRDYACRTFIEDYNTGTLPHQKYYDLAAYEETEGVRKPGRVTAMRYGTGPQCPTRSHVRTNIIIMVLASSCRTF